MKDTVSKLDKKALGEAVGLMLMSWAALPIVYYLIKRRGNKNEPTNDGEKQS